MSEPPVPRRHPLDVTSDRLLRHCEDYRDRLDVAAADALHHAKRVLQQLADEVCAPRELRPCGTVAAWKRHRRDGEEPCPDCRAAKAQEMRDYRNARTRR